MKKLLTKISSLVAFVLILCMSFSGCFLIDDDRPKIDVPEVVIGIDGSAVWGKINYAIYYIYVIDNGEEITTNERLVQLQENQEIKVKAVSGDENYADSDFSTPKTYKKKTSSDTQGDSNGSNNSNGSNGSKDEHVHSDVNSDGKCDVCSNSVIAELSFYAVNDLHGKFMDTDSQPGVDEFTTYLKNLYADAEREEILLASGDMWQGTVESSSNKGRLMTEWMNEVGFVSMTLGNHEYDWGAAVLSPNSQLAQFPFLAINVRQNSQLVDYCQASTIVEKSGVKIGIIGAIGDCLSSISGDFTDGLYFATDKMLTQLVRTEAQRLRKDEGCDFIVYSIHDGGENFSASRINDVENSDMSWYDSSLSDGYVDLVFEAHTHQRYILKDEYGVYHLQAGGENSYISCADVTFNTVTQEYVVKPRLIGSNEYASSRLDADPIVEKIFNQYFPDENPYTTVLGANRTDRWSNNICDLVAALYYNKGKEVWGKQYDIVLGGGYLKTRSPYNIAAGNVTYATLFSVLPFDNEIVLGSISGYYLKSQFLGGKLNYHVYTDLTESQIEDSKQYYIVVDSYTSTYYYNHITEVKRLDHETYARDLLAEYVKGGNWA